MTFINFKNYLDSINHFTYTFDRILLESKNNDKYQFRYEVALVDASHSNSYFKDYYFLHLLNYNLSDLLYFNYLK